MLEAMTRALATLALLGALAGCATLQQLAALQHVTFAYGGISDVRIAGIPIGPNASYASLGATNLAKLGAAVVSGQVPLEMIAHVNATNPEANSVAAKMVALDWTLFIEDRRTVAGGLANAVTIEPGRTTDVPLSAQLDLLELATGGGVPDIFDTAMEIAGYSTQKKDLRLELKPTIDTSLGPIQYPSPIVVHRPAN
jgi:hypothetical protein